MDHQKVFPAPLGRLSDTDRMLVETVAKWAEQDVIAKRAEHQEQPEALVGPALEKLFLDIGLQTLLIPESAGGGDQCGPECSLTLTALCEQIARADVGVALLLAETLSIQAAFNQNDIRVADLSSLFVEAKAPTIASAIFPDVGTGTDDPPIWQGMPAQVTATKESDWVINGTNVRPQVAGADANLFGVVIRNEKDEPGLLLVDGDAQGITRGEPFKKTGLAGSINADLTFKDVRVPAVRLALSGTDSFERWLCLPLLGYGASAVGALLASWEILKDWGEVRVIKGKGQVFKDNPLTASLMGKIGAMTATARLSIYQLADLLADPKTYASPTSEATHAIAAGIVHRVADDAMVALDYAMELMASAGYATEWNLERIWRDVKTLQTMLGPEPAATTASARHYFGSDVK
jgi:alkylation response protein AidB-like acyl-CoA dehydrogenase